MKARRAMDLPFVFDNTAVADTTAGTPGVPRPFEAKLPATLPISSRAGRPPRPVDNSLPIEVDDATRSEFALKWTGKPRAGVAAYNHSLKHHLPVWRFCSKSAAKSPALIALVDDPLEIDG
jgi:hypothetical protein